MLRPWFVTCTAHIIIEPKVNNQRNYQLSSKKDFWAKRMCTNSHGLNSQQTQGKLMKSATVDSHNLHQHLPHDTLSYAAKSQPVNGKKWVHSSRAKAKTCTCPYHVHQYKHLRYKHLRLVKSATIRYMQQTEDACIILNHTSPYLTVWNDDKCIDKFRS